MCSSEIKKTNLRPIGDNVIGLIVEEEKKNSGIILVNEEADRTSNVIDVIRVGKGRLTSVYTDEEGIQRENHIPVSIEPGQRVIIPKYAGTAIQQDDSTYIIFKEQDIIAVVE